MGGLIARSLSRRVVSAGVWCLTWTPTGSPELVEEILECEPGTVRHAAMICDPRAELIRAARARPPAHCVECGDRSGQVAGCRSATWTASVEVQRAQERAFDFNAPAPVIRRGGLPRLTWTSVTYSTQRSARPLPCAQLLPLRVARSTVGNVAEYLDLEAVAEILGIDRDSVYRLVRSTELLSIKVAAGWRVERAEVLRYKDSH
jgi:excisionase family DNA binding protein